MTLATAHQTIPVGQTFQVLPLRSRGAVGQLRQKAPGVLERVCCSRVSLGVGNLTGSLHLSASRVMPGPCPRRALAPLHDALFGHSQWTFQGTRLTTLSFRYCLQKKRTRWGQLAEIAVNVVCSWQIGVIGLGNDGESNAKPIGSKTHTCPTLLLSLQLHFRMNSLPKKNCLHTGNHVFWLEHTVKRVGHACPLLYESKRSGYAAGDRKWICYFSPFFKMNSEGFVLLVQWWGLASWHDSYSVPLKLWHFTIQLFVWCFLFLFCFY